MTDLAVWDAGVAGVVVVRGRTTRHRRRRGPHHDRPRRCPPTPVRRIRCHPVRGKRKLTSIRRCPLDSVVECGVDLLRFLKRAQGLGFTLDEVQEVLHLNHGGPDGCDAARTLAEAREADLRARIADLQRMIHSS